MPGTVKIYAKDDSGVTVVENAKVVVKLVTASGGDPGFVSGGGVLAGPKTQHSDNTGLTSWSLTPNASIVPAGTVYRFEVWLPGERRPRTDHFTVPGTSTYEVDDILSDPPGDLETSALTAHKLTVGDHGDVDLTGNAVGKVLMWDGTNWVPADTVATDIEAAALVTAHAAVTTGVHGIADTSLLETTAGAAAKVLVETNARIADVDAEESARIASDATLQTNITSEATARANADTAHESDTTNVHGITDTAQVALKNASQTFTAEQSIEATDTSDGNKVYTFRWHKDAATGSGMRGLDLERSATGKPLGIGFQTAGTRNWDMGLDATTDDLVFAYDPDTPGDLIRLRKGGHLLFGHSVVQPANTYRFRLEATSDDPATMTDLVVLHGDTAHSGGNMTHILRATNGTETAFSVMASGNVGVGVLSPTQKFQVTKTQDATTQFLLSNGNAGSSSKVSFRLQSDAHSLFFDMTSSTWGTASVRDAAHIYTNNTDLLLGTNSTERMRLSAAGSVVIGTAAIATTATDGFLYIPASAGPPTGVPTAKTGRVAMHYDSTNNIFYFYNGGWKGVEVAA